MRRGPAALGPRLAAAGLGVLALYVLSSLGAPLGAVGDDALHILLARAFRHGSFVLPSGLPAADPLPGFAALLALPAALVEPHWDLLKLLGPLSAAAALALTWRLARRFLSEGAALSVVLLTALNAVLVDRVGLVLPDLPYLALSLFVLDAVGDARSTGALAGLAAAAAACSLLRPYGALLAVAAALALTVERGWRKAAAFGLAALTPLALWTLRGRLLSAGGGYATSLGDHAALLSEPRAFAVHAASLLGAMGGDGLLALRGSSGLLAAAGLAAAGAAAWGAARLLKRREDPRAFAIACYCVLMAVQHMLWMPVAARYILPLVPLAWILIIAGLPSPARAGKFGPTLALCAAVALPLRLDLAAARSGLRGPASFQPETMAWIRRATPPGARFQSLEWPGIALLGERTAIQPVVTEGYRDDWLAWTFEQRADWVLVSKTLALDGQFLPEAARLQETLERFALSSPYGSSARSDEREGTVVIHLQRPDPKRFEEAWTALSSARSALGRGSPAEEARARLREAVALEPRLAIAWAYLAALENDPRRRRALFAKAAALDPTSADFRAGRLQGSAAQ